MQDDVNVTRGLPPRVRGEPLSGTFNLSCISPRCLSAVEKTLNDIP